MDSNIWRNLTSYSLDNDWCFTITTFLMGVTVDQFGFQNERQSQNSLKLRKSE